MTFYYQNRQEFVKTNVWVPARGKPVIEIMEQWDMVFLKNESDWSNDSYGRDIFLCPGPEKQVFLLRIIG